VSRQSSSIVGDKSALVDYIEFKRPVKLKTANSEAPIYSVDEGILPILLTSGKSKFIIKLSEVQLVLDMDETIISVSAFNQQFNASLVLNPRCGY